MKTAARHSKWQSSSSGCCTRSTHQRFIQPSLSPNAVRCSSTRAVYCSSLSVSNLHQHPTSSLILFFTSGTIACDASDSIWKTNCGWSKKVNDRERTSPYVPFLFILIGIVCMSSKWKPLRFFLPPSQMEWSLNSNLCVLFSSSCSFHSISHSCCSSLQNPHWEIF